MAHEQTREGDRSRHSWRLSALLRRLHPTPRFLSEGARLTSPLLLQTEDWTGSDRFNGTGWANTEYRTYTFSTHDAANAHLIETPESRQRRTRDTKPLDTEEKTNLKRTSTQEMLDLNKGVLRSEHGKEIEAKV